ncbi:MAG: alpha/beta hydrolase [Acidobacteriota bacterium]|jgi:hypothetical protein
MPANSKPERTGSAATKPAKARRMQPRYHPGAPPGSAPAEMIPLVELGWILKALAVVFLAAFLCAYATICIIFSRTQWQLVLHPSRSLAGTPASFQLPFIPVQFGVDRSGLPQLTGWWIPAQSQTLRSALILHSGDGSSADALPVARLLHQQNLNVLLFDYRGYGRSGGLHPTETTMEADAETALGYLTSARFIPPSSIVVYGLGLGASLAVHLCAKNPALPALILQSPDGDLTERVRRDPRAKLVPFRQIFNEPFPLSDPLHHLSTPRLILNHPPSPAELSGFLSAHLRP